MSRLIRTPAAEDDLLEIAHYIAVEQSRPQTAERVIDDLIAKCGEYAISPLAGTAAPVLGADYRLFHFKRWVVVYRPITDGIEVMRIFDGARDYPRFFGAAPQGP
jgi:toxin ParE1/3/4